MIVTSPPGRLGTLAAVVFGLAVAGVAPAQPGQATRLARDEPEILLTPGGRTGVGDVVAFTADGSRLYAVGEDKVVHDWTVTPDRLVPNEPFHWNTFRERRGAIFSLAQSDDPGNPRIAVAGFGKLTSDVAVFDPRTGKLVAALSAALDPNYKASDVVWSLRFRPGGKELAIGDDGGNVWTWRLDDGPGPRVKRVATGPKQMTYESRAAWVGYTPDGRLAYGKRDGGVYAADGSVLFQWSIGKVDKISVSGDGKWLAAQPYRETETGSRVEIRSFPDGKIVKFVPFERGRFPDRIVLDKTGDRLAVGVADFGRGTSGRGKRPFAIEPLGEIAIYDLRPAEPVRTTGVDGLDMRPDTMAFHPDGKRFASAGGADHATILWSIDGGRLKEIAADRGKARSLWGVGMSADGRFLMFKDHRNPDPIRPNDRGAGDWVTFDIQKSDWSASKPTPVPAQETRDGWRVEPDPTRDSVWYVVGPDGNRQKLPLDELRDDLPRCYTFLPADRKGAVRLAVGHLWGVSVFELATGEQPKRVRRFAGHAGYVTAIAPALDGRALVSCGRDQVVALWCLADFSSNPVLGAAFAVKDGKFTVTAVDNGSPAEEAGLSKGDVVTWLAVGGDPRGVPAAEWADRLAAAEPGQEVAFMVRREGYDKDLPAKTALLHRPVARFFPTRDDEWVLYTYRQCYYDCSPNGDRYLAWLVSTDRADVAPDVLPVERFRVLRRPDKVAEVVSRLVREPCKPILPDLFPPEVTIKAARNPANPGEVVATVSVTPRARQDGKVNPIEKVEVWINGHYRADFKRLDGEKFEPGKAIALTFKFPVSSLRAGTNEVRAVAVARDAGIGESRPEALTGPAGGTTRGLFGVVAGIDDYEALGASLTCAVRDAERVRDAWVGRYAGRAATTRGLVAKRVPLLTDQAVTRESILKAVEAAKDAGPDDLFVMFLSGHGMLGKDVGGADEWYYAIPRSAGSALTRSDFRNKKDRVRSTFLRDDQLFNALAGLRCQTIVILDCCHSGAAAQAVAKASVATQVRSLRPYGYGPIVIASCGPSEKSYESDGQGYFTNRLVRALGADMKKADKDSDSRLSAVELFEYVRAGVGQDVAGIVDSDTGEKIRQTPQIVPPVDTLNELILAEPRDPVEK